MLRFAPASAGRQGRTISWLLIAALLISAFSSVLPSAIQPQVAKAADRIGEAPEAQRCAEFLRDSSPAAYEALLA